MTKDEILAMEPGCEMDALIAEWMGEAMPDATHAHDDVTSVVLSEKKMWYCALDFDCGDICVWSPKQFTSNMSYAWEVVMELARRGFAPNLIYDDEGHWALSLSGIQDMLPTTRVTAWIDYPELWCDDAAHAICKATLLNAAEMSDAEMSAE